MNADVREERCACNWEVRRPSFPADLEQGAAWAAKPSKGFEQLIVPRSNNGILNQQNACLIEKTKEKNKVNNTVLIISCSSRFNRPFFFSVLFEEKPRIAFPCGFTGLVGRTDWLCCLSLSVPVCQCPLSAIMSLGY